jgi:tight adherence protein B
MMLELLAALAIGGAVLLLVMFVIRARRPRAVDTRVRNLVEKPAPQRRGIEWEDVQRHGGSRVRFFAWLLRDSKWAVRTQEQLEQAGTRLHVGEYVAIRIGLAVVTFVVIALIGRTPVALFLALVAAVIGLMAPAMWLRSARHNRAKTIAKQLPEAVTMMANALRAGFAFQHGIDMVAKQMEPPIADEFNRVMVDLNVGSSVEDALAGLLERADSEDMNMMVTAIMIQRTSGGNLAEILDTVAETMRERERLVGEVRTLTSQQRFSGIVLTLWPLFILAFFSLLNWDQTSLLFTEPLGQVMVAAMAIGTLLGYLTIRRILDVEV